jgi:hypothetical protein
MRVAQVRNGQRGLTPRRLAENAVEDDPGEDEYDDPRQREELEGTPAPLAPTHPRSK